MKRCFALAALIVAGGAWGATPGPVARAEIAHLLDYLQASHCDFYRNGAWYDSIRARNHLERKQQYLLDHGMIGTAEEFIARAATASSLSGETYLVRCRPAAPVSSSSWLTAELASYRRSAASRAAGRSERH